MSLQEFNGLSQELSKELLKAVSGGYMVTLSNAGTDYCEKIWGLIDPNKPWEEQAEGLPVQ